MKAKNFLLLLKYAFVLLLLASSIGKLLDNRGFSEVIVNYDLVPAGLTLYLGLAISLFELALGLSIFIEYKLKECALLTILMHLGYTALASITLWRGISLSNCGCFGVFLGRPLSMQTVFEDLFLVLLSIAFYRLVDAKEKA